MTMRARRPRRRDESGDTASREESRAAFVEQAAAEETAQLHCLIPERLHRRLRVASAEERTTITALVTEALESFFEGRS